VISNEEVQDKVKLLKIAQDTISKNGICVLINFNRSQSFDEQAFRASFKKHSHSGLKEMNGAKEKVKDICGYMELTEISSFFHLYLK